VSQSETGRLVEPNATARKKQAKPGMPGPRAVFLAAETVPGWERAVGAPSRGVHCQEGWTTGKGNGARGRTWHPGRERLIRGLKFP
jgi:hypothetical protein